MPGDEQVKPLAPASLRISSDYNDEAMSVQPNKLHKRNCIMCCGCVTALLLIIAVTMLVLIFTVFRIKDPIITMNQVTIQQMVNTSINRDLTQNVTLVADVSVKNPNVVSFKFGNTTTTASYGGTVVGEGRGPAGRAKAKRSIRMNITLDIMPQRLLAIPRFWSDVSSGALNMSSYTSISGKVKVLKIFNKHVVVRMNCTFTYNVSTQAILQDQCVTHVKV
ncbi:LEA_2 domain-containing protein [Cephalotus follicularis]|uniref:LEA_2 domain-containing protein n=1 Tax=Cephalotus follicularis TaxID=3775 RepID=A0A1Q3CXZ0_CEPFO|nr:LEA_2 domain-containing protein [Cephalotus follicularis]